MSDTTLLMEILDLLKHIAARQGVEAPPALTEEFRDIEPGRLYSVAELAELRGGSRQSYYKAMDAKRLRETLSAGTRQVRGCDFIDFLRSKRKR